MRILSQIPTLDNICNFIAEYGTAYPVEIATAFSLPRVGGHTALNVESYTRLPDIADELIKRGDVAMAPKGNGFMFYTLKPGESRLHQKRREMAGIL